jgi:hypothetical protein
MFKKLNEQIQKYIEDEYNHKDLQKALDDIFKDISTWVFPFVDLELLRMYDEQHILADFPDAEIIRYMTENNYAVFEVDETCKQELEKAGVSFEDYKGMTFVTPVLDVQELRTQVIKGIEEGEF